MSNGGRQRASTLLTVLGLKGGSQLGLHAVAVGCKGERALASAPFYARDDGRKKTHRAASPCCTGAPRGSRSSTRCCGLVAPGRSESISNPRDHAGRFTHTRRWRRPGTPLGSTAGEGCNVSSLRRDRRQLSEDMQPSARLAAIQPNEQVADTYTAVDALGHVNVVPGRPPRAVLARLGLDRDSLSRADGFAELAGCSEKYSWSEMSVIAVTWREAGAGVTDRCSAPRPRRSDGERARHGTGTKPVPFLLSRRRGISCSPCDCLSAKRDVPKGYMIV